MQFFKLMAIGLAYAIQRAPGDFSTSVISEIQKKADSIWTDSQLQSDYIAEVETLKAIKAQQTAEIATDEHLTSKNKDYGDISVHWVKTCSIAVEDVESNCTIDEAEVETDKKDYLLASTKKVGFSVDEEKLRTSIFSKEEVVAKAQLMALKELDEFVTQNVIAKLKTYADAPAANSVAGLGLYNQTGALGSILVANGDYKATMYARLVKAALLNKMRNSYMIDGGELFIEKLNADYDKEDVRGAYNRFQTFPIYYDLFNFAAAGITEDTFLIAKSAVAFASKTRNPDVPTEVGGTINQTIFTVPSQNIPGLRYDAYYQLNCKTVNGKAHYIHNWRYQAVWDLLQNPENCAGFGGVLSFTKGPVS